ncbi:MAG: hypothetical protein OEV44_05200 [Spirochaetota bacterium]|nr:hypothetical protein [Spirochaetota bacterium]
MTKTIKIIAWFVILTHFITACSSKNVIKTSVDIENPINSISNETIAIIDIISLINKSTKPYEIRKYNDFLINNFKNINYKTISANEIAKKIGEENYQKLLNTYRKEGKITNFWYNKLNNDFKDVKYFLIPVIESHGVSRDYRESDEDRKNVAILVAILIIFVIIVALASSSDNNSNKSTNRDSSKTKINDNKLHKGKHTGEIKGRASGEHLGKYKHKHEPIRTSKARNYNRTYSSSTNISTSLSLSYSKGQMESQPSGHPSTMREIIIRFVLIDIKLRKEVNNKAVRGYSTNYEINTGYPYIYPLIEHSEKIIREIIKSYVNSTYEVKNKK